MNESMFSPEHSMECGRSRTCNNYEVNQSVLCVHLVFKWNQNRGIDGGALIINEGAHFMSEEQKHVTVRVCTCFYYCALPLLSSFGMWWKP
jgi:hypothetical protein